MKHNIPKPVEYFKRNSEREIYSGKCIYLEIRKISNKEPNVSP